MVREFFSKASMICVNSISCQGVAVLRRVLMLSRLRCRLVSVTMAMICILLMITSIHPSRLVCWLFLEGLFCGMLIWGEGEAVIS